MSGTPHPSPLKRMRVLDAEYDSDVEEGARNQPAARQLSPQNANPEHNNEQEGSEGEDEIDDDIPVEMRLPNRAVLLGRAVDDCKRNAKKAKRSMKTSYVASGAGDVVQENSPAAVLASSVSDGLRG